MTIRRILIKNNYKIKFIVLIFLFVILFYIFQIYYNSILLKKNENNKNENNKNENNKNENKLKQKFVDETFIEIDQSKERVLVENIDNSSVITMGMERTFTNKELEDELLRRQQFNLYWQIKTKSIDESLKKVIFSFRLKKFINQVFTENYWQLKLFGESRPYIVKSVKPNDHLPEVANGYIGISGFSDEIQMQSLFSGSFMETHRASIPSWNIRNITAIYDLNGNNIIIGRRVQLDMSNGRLSQVIFSEHCIVEQQIYVHQVLKSLIVHEIRVQFLNSTVNTIVLKLPKGRKSDISSNVHITKEFSNISYIKIISGLTHTNDLKDHQQRMYAYFHQIPDEIKVTKSNIVSKYYYIMSVNEDKNTAMEHLSQGEALIEDNNALFKKHDSVWQDLWTNSAVFMRRSISLDIPLISAQYLINSNLPSIGRIDHFGAMGATGLGVISNQGVGHSLGTNCGGRIEFTQELWMINAQMLLHPQSVKSIINNRIAQLPMAKSKAMYFDYTGAKYPAATNELGEDLCETFPNCQNIIFPSGVVAMSIDKYLLATEDRSMFTELTCLGVLIEINEFWKSILHKYKISKIENSVPLTNFNLNVRKSVFNMGLMKETLLIIPELFNFFNVTPKTSSASYFLELYSLSESIIVPINQHLRSYPPFSDYDKVKGAWYLPEGVMLRYPLDHIIDSETNERNLRFYEKMLLRPFNPMTLSILFINNMDADRISEAEDNFRTLIKFNDNAFKVWMNDSSLWKGSYIPAGAAYLDSIMFGILGIRIRRSGLYMYPKLILDISFIKVSNVKYLGSIMEVIVERSKGLCIRIISRKPSASKLVAVNVVSSNIKLLEGLVTFPLGTHIVIKRLKVKKST